MNTVWSAEDFFDRVVYPATNANDAVESVDVVDENEVRIGFYDGSALLVSVKQVSAHVPELCNETGCGCSCEACDDH